jgi:hypothetical protein
MEVGRFKKNKRKNSIKGIVLIVLLAVVIYLFLNMDSILENFLS